MIYDANVKLIDPKSFNSYGIYTSNKGEL